MCTIKGYITNVGKYNEGYLLGEWITFPINEEELQEVFERIGINQEYEEYFFTDYECDITNLYRQFGEYASVNQLNEIAEQLDSLYEYDIEKLEAIIECLGGDLEDIIENLDDYIYYSGMTLEDVAYDIINECYDLPEFALRYFDYAAFARDLSFDGYYETSNGVICSH